MSKHKTHFNRLHSLACCILNSECKYFIVTHVTGKSDNKILHAKDIKYYPFLQRWETMFGEFRCHWSHTHTATEKAHDYHMQLHYKDTRYTGQQYN